MDESQFHTLSDQWFTRIFDALEGLDALEVEYGQGILTVETSAGKTFVVSKHAPSKQLWLASPVSGGLHFPHCDGKWVLADGRVLEDVLMQELGIS